MAPPSSSPKMPPRSSRTLVLLSAYAVIMTISCSYLFVRDISKQLTLRNRVDAETSSYELHFMPEPSGRVEASRKHGKANKQQPSEEPRRRQQSEASSQDGRFPLAQHIVTHGHPRTATTLLFNMVATSYFLHLSHSEPSRIPSIHLQLWKRGDAANTVLRREKKKTLVLKTHVDLDNFKANNTVVFTAAMDRAEAAETRHRLLAEGYQLAFVQDMESLREWGVAGLVAEYVRGYGLSSQDEQELIEYFSQWEILRQCCGQQMSSKWRNDMMPSQYKRKDLPPHPTCASYDIDQVENKLMQTKLYARIAQYPNMTPLNKPSLNDDALNGTYCSAYNHRVRTEGLSFFGTPGGRPVRSGLDWAIKNEYSKGTENLTQEGVAMMESIGMRELWRRDEKQKKIWLKKLLRERTVKMAKSYKGLNLEEIDDTLVFDVGTDENEQEEDYSIDDEEQDSEGQSDINAYDEDNSENAEEAFPTEQTRKIPAIIPIQDQNFDKKHAIFLISFGEEAASSTLVERCILSLRRRGQYLGYVVVLTDAPLPRYLHVWDENVIVMHPQRKHLLNEDGTPISYSKDNMSLKPKRFKTFILDYIAMDERLDSVELVYYLDIDILAGDTLDGLFRGLEEKYQVAGQRPNDDVSKLYFFTPISQEWPLQGGTFIVERGTSQHCLDLWRAEIDMMTKTGRGRDQDALRNIYQRIESGEETKCQLIRMENENYIAFPTPRNFDKLSSKETKHANLIHISNSVYAKRIEEDIQNTYIHEVLMLSEEEVESGMYGKAVVRAKEST
ncbi:hypothetical protein HJC23_001877 [Cyclotella cryptica]|uniref:Glycosyltransferase family 8 protein n=1 Tax=Cyclotella cryptica TaxID=29204 RepID=A0ABD3PKN5_9STRA|eukprot:CCRYP_013663-RA/>CCRYP_013663-RA protein AED:0.15 eAED:0.15 QI:0/-1/0/1/-1/1/1/0/784